MISSGTMIGLVLAILAIVVVWKIHVIVPQQNAYVVERLGQFHKILNAGFHLLVPFVDRVAYRHSLKEEAVDIPQQDCVTSDNVIVGVDGILYFQIIEPQKASYGSANPLVSISALAQTSLRSEIGKMDLDKTFSERVTINTNVVDALDKASEPWGYKVLRYEIKDIIPPPETVDSMAKLVAADREKRAMILESEGEKQAVINAAEGDKQQVVLASEAQREKEINEAEGQATAIERLGLATAEAIRKVGEAIEEEGGEKATQLRVAEQWVVAFGELAKESNTLVIPAQLNDTAGMIAAASKVFDSVSDSSKRISAG